ncbi:MAG: ribonuclease HII [Myxococcales bacterium]|nr:MAG: ribonuclease HII [Myxococcales bacterium]
MPELRLSEIRTRYVEGARPLPTALEVALRADPRAGARAILEAVERKRRERRAEGQRLRWMLEFERELWKRDVVLIAGVDEAGMSPLAGPVAAAAVVLEPDWRAPGINDSKQVPPERRAELAQLIKREARAWAVAFVEPEEIDQLNIYWAGIAAMRRAVEALGITPEHLLIDARVLRDVAIEQTRIVKGDERSLSIAAASILAKTERDARMLEHDRAYPGYGFARHKGYPVREHQAALRQHGACPIHRRSFGPVREALGLPPLEPPKAPGPPPARKRANTRAAPR